MHMKPFGYFDANPMLDLPASTGSHYADGAGFGSSDCGCAKHEE